MGSLHGPRPFGPKKVFKQVDCCLDPLLVSMSSESIGGKPKLEIDDLFIKLLSEKEIRDHLAVNGTVLFPESMTESVKTASSGYVRPLLVPLLEKMVATEGSPQPTVEPLRYQISELYKRCSKQVPGSQVIHDSWMIRKFLGFVKMKARIRKPSTALWLHEW